MTKQSEAKFDLEKWASKEKYFVDKDSHARATFYGLVSGRKQGFTKACEVILEEIESSELAPNLKAWIKGIVDEKLGGGE